MRKDKTVLERYEAGEEVPVGEMAGVIVGNGCLGIIQGLLGMVLAMVAMFVAAALAGMPGFIAAAIVSLWLAYRVYARNRAGT